MISVLRPVFALFTRALREDLRATFPIVFRTLLVVLLLGLHTALHYNSTTSASGLRLLLCLAVLNFGGITLLGLATFPTAITEEKDDDSLGLLRMTRLNPLAILLGKSTARLAGGLLFLAVQVPFALLCATMGGVSFAQIFKVYAILGAVLFFLCNLGLVFSVVSRNSMRAVAATAATSVALLLIAPWEYLAGSSSHFWRRLTAPLARANPALHLYSTIFHRGPLPLAPSSFGFLLVGGVLCFLVAWLGFEFFCARTRLVLPAGAPPIHRQLRIPRPWRHALTWKDFYFSVGGVGKIILRQAFYVGAMFVYFFQQEVWVSFHPLPTVARGAQLCGTIGLAVECSIAAAALFGTERRERTLGALCILPVPLGRVIFGKLCGRALTLMPAFFLAVTGFAVAAACEMHTAHPDFPPAYFASLFNLILQFAVFGSAIACLSLYLRRGALACGAIICLLWNFFFGLILFKGRLPFVPSREYTDGPWHGAEREMLWALNFFLICVTVVLAAVISRRLPECAAED